MSSDRDLLLTVDERDSELAERLHTELLAFNDAHTGGAERRPLSVKVTDEAGDLVGGLIGRSWGGLLDIHLLWVREQSRVDGWGSRLLRAAEAEALRRGCVHAVVSSFTFQAPGFYQCHGYVETGRAPGIPGGHEDVHLYKRLAEPTV